MQVSLRRVVFGLALIAAGLLIRLVPSDSPLRLIGAIVGICLGYLWFAERRIRGGPSPWLLGLGLALIVDALDAVYRLRVPFIPAALVLTGLVYLLTARWPD